MIVKELDPITSSDKRLQAGHKAEKQLAFYLRRAFGDHPKIQVINGLRLRRSGAQPQDLAPTDPAQTDHAQIDHLILHNHGLIIFESKSVTTRLRVNLHGEWSRWSGKQWQGMPSPVLQARRQADFLRQILLTRKGLDKRVDWQQLPIDSLIAISDTGILNRPDNRATPNICKAEKVTDRVLSLVQQRSRGENLLGWLKVVFEDTPTTLSDDTLNRLSQRLVALHRPSLRSSGPRPSPRPNPQPLKKAPAPQVPSPTQPDRSANAAPEIATTCPHCQSAHLTIVYGKYGYYFKCGECDRNTAIKVSCPSCQAKAKLRKQKLNFFINCSSCSKQTLYHRNPE